MSSNFKTLVCNLRFSPSTTKHGFISLALPLLFISMAPNLTAAQPSGSNPPDPYAYAKFSPSMAIIVVVLISALFFMGFFSIYIRHCTQSNSTGSVHPRGSVRARREAATLGLEPSVIETFPLLDYSEVKDLKIGDRALECAVCLCEFEDEETLRLIPKCDHVFHPECIDAWLASHTTCPVCRANLAQPTDSQPGQLTESARPEFDIESQHDAVESGPQDVTTTTTNGDSEQVAVPEAQVIDINQTLNRNRTRRSRSSRQRVKFPRSHSTGHSLVQPGEDTERFTLRLPADVRKQVVNRQLNRTRSLLVFAREGSTRKGYRTGGEGSSRGKHNSYRRLEPLDRLGTKSDRWVLTKTLSFFSRASSVKSPKVVVNDGEGTSTRPVGTEASNGDSVRLPV